MKIRILPFFCLITISFAKCGPKLQFNKEKIFDSVSIPDCRCEWNNNTFVNFKNILVTAGAEKINENYYYPINTSNIMNIKGYLRREHDVIYYLPKNHNNSKEQKLFDFTARAKESWTVQYNSSLQSSYIFLRSSFDTRMNDTVFLYHVNTKSPIATSHHPTLKYLEVGKRLGIVCCYYSEYHGYRKYEFYPSCKLSALSYQESRDLDSAMIGCSGVKTLKN